MKRFLATAASAVVLALGATAASAQSPSEQIGFGFTAGQLTGGHVAYALSPGLHIGTGFGMQIQEGNNIVYFAPYAKFLLKGPKELKPFFMAQFEVASGGGTSTTGLSVSGGGEYFVTPNVGIYGQIALVSIQFDPSVTTLGLLRPSVGIEWFLD